MRREQKNSDLDADLKDLELQLPRKRLLENLKYNAEKLRDLGKNIEMYTAGFLRLPFTRDRYQDGYALHVWRKNLPYQDTLSIHKHNSLVRSRVLRGKVRNRNWRIVSDPDGEYGLVGLVPDENQQPVLTEIARIRLEEKDSLLCGRDQVYEIPQYEFHSSEVTRGTVTLMEKRFTSQKDQPLSVIPVNSYDREWDNSYRYPQDQAWDIVMRALRSLE